ncbi:long-chain fatty acid--CoA ligase [Paenibacillus sp. ACRRX]|uniref:long-chain-fatty-acid--CoA ligase n=1 Tax=Paenibacillus sp. ACRRX TaxID=2918206 RepID=UPI001EF702B0|nr:long-chain fatty acid--CoA ligase [Paenibacillus sp. ACRRX]MCG7407401.1 long-chain fatty acid--CoA ligase [Paenibacillus sp. ACRRX]
MLGDQPWLVHYPAEVASTFDYPKHNVGRLLIDAASAFPTHTAVEFMGGKLTYQELLDGAYRFADGLHSLGIKPGERVAIMLPNCPQVIIAYFGTLLYGGIAVMTNPLYMEGELTQQLSDSGAVVIVTLDLLFKRVLRVKPHTQVQHIIVASIAEYLPFPKNWIYPIKAKKDGQDLHVPDLPSVYKFKAWLKRCHPHQVCKEVDAERDVAILQYTGGTTGIAKGVMLTHYNLIANTIQTANWFYQARRGKEVFLAALPCFHVFGLTVLLNQAVHLAGQIVLLPRFDPKQVLAVIEKKQVSIFPGAPTMYIAINHHPDVKSYNISSIRACVSGSAPLPQEVQEQFEALTGGRLIEGYGLTEASPVTHANNVWDYRKLGSIGIPFPDTEARIVNAETGEQLAVGEIGELIVRGPQVMVGYWQRQAETAAVLRDGWLYTGDMGKMDAEGFFYIVDRKKDMINASGFKVYPRDVEEVLFEHPDIKEAVVIGVPDAYRGETVKAYVILKDGSDVTAEQIIAWCRGHLAAFKVPRLVEFRTELPKTMVGKVLRRKLLEEVAQEQIEQALADEKVVDKTE